jgi:cytochrome c biogenesis protein CcdA/thiol-disulfide isomerase/thioredoxin
VRKAVIFVLVLFILGLPGWVLEIEAQEPVVRILLFYSKTCPHCEDVINNFLPDIQEKYSDQLEVKLLDISEQANFELALALEEVYGIPEAEAGIPEIFIGHTPPLIGSYVIREQLDGLVQEYLDAGGVDFPSPEQLALLVTPMPTATPTSTAVPTGVVRILLFHSPTCPHCEVVINDVLPGIQEKYGDQIEIKLLDLSDPYNYGLFLALVEAAKIPSENRAIPMMFVGPTFMVGDLSIKDNLEEVIDKYLAEGGTDYPISEELLAPPTSGLTATPQPTPTAQAENRPIHIAYFYEIGCQECDRVTYDLNYLQSKYPNLVVETFDVQNDAALSEWLGEQYGVPEEKRLTTPSVFLGQDYLFATEINVKSLEALLEKYSQTGTEAIWEDFGEEEASEARTSLIERIGSPALLTVLGTGLANGLNPCALATIVFFISYLAFSGRKGREILFVGVAFTLGVFLTYLLAGFGLLRLLEPLDAMRSDLRNWISGLGALLCLVLALISFRDYFTARRGRPENVSLRLPRPLQRQVHRIIRESSNVRAFVLVAFAIGFVISVILLTCTSPLYVGVLFLITDVPELKASAYLNILLYNLAFITPLVVIFLLAYFGTTSEQLARVVGRYTGAIKLLTASLFLVLAGLLIYGLI